MFIISVVLFFIVSMISCGEAEDRRLTVTKQELLSEYQLVVLEKNPVIDYASKELLRYLKKTTGKDIEINYSVKKDILEGKYIILGTLNDRYIKDILGLDTKIPGKEGFLIKKFENSILILGKEHLGVLYGVYYFLERYVGFRFFSKDYTYVPENLLISLQEEDFQVPRFSYREVFIRESDNPNFALKRFLNGRLGHRNLKPLKFGNRFVKLHSIFQLVPPKIYRKSHPEYFCGGQIDFTNEEVKEIALKNAEKILNKYRDLQERFYFVIGNADIGTFCYNRKSRERIKEGGAPSTPYLDFVLYLAERLGKRYPNAIFTASAYLWSRKPPKSYRKLPNNVAIFFSDIEADFSKPINSKENRSIYRDLIGWSKISNHIIIWHYITNFNNYFQPYPNIFTVAQDIKEFSKIKQIEGIFLQGSYGTYYGDMSDLKVYVFSKLLWNPDLNVDELIDEFIRGFYGEAYLYIKDYLKLLYDSLNQNPYPLKPKMISHAPYLNAEFFLKAEKLLNSALESVKDKMYFYEHVRRLKFGVDIMLLLNNPQLRKEAEKKGLKWFNEDYVNKLKQEVEQFIKEKNVKTFSEGGKIKELLTLIRIDRGKTSYPEEVLGLKHGKDWFDYQEYNLQVCCGAKFEEDIEASDRVTVSMPGSTTAWGISLNLDFLPEGKWKIFFTIKVKPSKSFSEEDLAFRYGVYRKTRVKEAFLRDFIDGKYHTVEVGTFKRGDGNLWIAPPGNSSVEKIYVDRVFIRKEGY